MLGLLMSLMRRSSNCLAARSHTGTLVGGECRPPRLSMVRLRQTHRERLRRAYVI